MRFARPLAILAAISLFLGSMSWGAAQVTGSQWTSPTYGFSVSWLGTDWQIDPNGTLTGVGPERLDRIHLVNGVSSLYFEGATRYEGDLASCVAEEANILSREPGVSEVRPLLDERGERIVASGPDSEAAAFTLTLDIGGQQLELVDYVECQTLIPGEAVLIVTLVTDPAAFERELAAAMEVVETIALAGDIPLSPLAAYGGLIAAARQAPSIAGPLAGELAFGPGTLAVARAGVDAPDFYARVEFANPQPDGPEMWDIGLGFRDSGGEEQLRLVVDAEGAWFLKDGLGPVIAQGVLVDVDTSADGTNVIELVAVGDTGYFGFNERLVTELDLSARPVGGDLFAGAGFFAEDAAEPGTASYSGLEVWSLSGLDAEESPQPAVMLDAATFAERHAAASAEPPLAGPVNGELAQTLGAAVLAPAGVEVEQFAAEATFVNPSAAADAPWDFGIVFREQEDGDHYRITVSSDGSWEFQIGLEPDLSGGVVPALNFGEGARNTIEVMVADDGAAFSVNGAFVAQLDVSALSGSSDVWVGSGFHRAGATDGAITRYEGFTVWPLAPAPGDAEEVASPPTAVAATPVAPRATPVVAELTLREVALRLHERNDSGIDALAVLRGAADGTEVSVTARDARGGEIVAVYEGACDAPATMPLFLLSALDASGSSETTIGSQLDDLTGGEHSIAIHRGAADDEVVACGEIPAQE